MTQLATVDEFRFLCRKHFKFLTEEFGCVLSILPDITVLPQYMRGFEMAFDNQTTRICVSLEVHDKFPCVWLSPAQSINRRLELSWFINQRHPELKTLPVYKESFLHPSAFAGLELIMEHQARCLRECALDVVQGDFKEFYRIEELANTMAREAKNSKDPGIPVKLREIRFSSFEGGPKK